MKMIKPIAIDSSKLISSTIPDSDNRWAMFDNKSRVSSSANESIEIEICPGELFNSVALLNLTANQVEIVVVDPSAGEVYRQQSSLIDLSAIDDYYDWFFEPISLLPSLVLLDLPAYATANIIIRISGTGQIGVGEIVIGKQYLLGILKYGSITGIVDYSVTTRDDNGNVVLTPKGYSDYLQYPITMDSKRVYAVKRMLADHRAQGLVFIGDEDDLNSTIYGYYKDFAVTIAGKLKSTCTLEIEEMN